MTITELTDNTMVVMKDSADPPWISVGDIARNAIRLFVVADDDHHCVAIPNEFVYSGRALVMFFGERLDKGFKNKHKVLIKALPF